MYKLPANAQKVMDLYNSFEWNEVVQMQLQSVNLNDNKVMLHDKEVVSFGNASYLGFHKDERAIEAGIEKMRQNGLLYCATRSYTYMQEHEEFESLLGKIFSRPTIATVQTAMASFGAMPLLMQPNQVALIDTMAHATLQNMVMVPKANGLTVERIMHNDMAHLESKIKLFIEKGVEKIWYICDSVYSMYGDTAPMLDLLALLDKYDNFYLYIDDAHGMSWAGPNGAGYAWKFLPNGHDKVVMATSLGKGFGLGGGALVCPNEEVKMWMKRAGLNLVFCTQLSNQMLGSGIEIAKIHLSNEIYVLQDKIKQNIDHFIKRCRENNLELQNYDETPLFYMAFSGNNSFQYACALNHALRNKGYYANLGTYPAVPVKHCGLRISLTVDHSFEEIDGLIAAIVETKNELVGKVDVNLNATEVDLEIKKAG